MNFAVSLLQLLPGQIAVYTRFLDLLRVEQAVLAHAQPDALENCTAERGRLIVALEAQDVAMRALFTNAKIAFSSQAVKQASATLVEPQRSQLAECWQQLLGLVDACKKHNDINGKIVDTRHQHTRRALGILMGQTTPAGTTYAADGHVQPGTASATLATA